MAQFPSDDPNVSINGDIIDDKKAITEVTCGSEDATKFNAQAQAKILRKLDWHLLPLITLLYFFSFLDRTNIGNARIAGMEKDLNLVGLRYNIAASMFFVTYCFAQVPSNIMLKFVRPSRWIPIIMVTWGLIMTLMCLVNTYHQLIIARVFLGIAEAGLFPGMAYYISLWYPRTERAKRFAIFTSAATVAGAFGGIMAYGIEKMEGLGGLHGWQWIFCLEGLATIVAALAAPFFMYDCPETASFLTDAERRYVVELMRTDSQGLATHYDIQFVLQALKDYKTYLQFGMLIGFLISIYSISLFTPTIIKELGFSAANAQLLSVPPFAAGCVCSLLVGVDSDKRQIRGPYVIGSAVVAMAGFLILYTQVNPDVALVGVIIAAMGIFSGAPIIIAWITSNVGGDVKRGVVIATVSGLATTGGICASFIFFDPPRFHVGLGVCMGLLGCSILTCSFMMWDYNRMNKERKEWCHEHGITDKQKDEFEETGDNSPLFRYTL